MPPRKYKYPPALPAYPAVIRPGRLRRLARGRRRRRMGRGFFSGLVSGLKKIGRIAAPIIKDTGLISTAAGALPGGSVIAPILARHGYGRRRRRGRRGGALSVVRF